MSSKEGFTLIELIIVFAIISVIVIASSIGLSQLQSVFRLRSSGDEVRGLIQLGREYSLVNKDSATYGISLSTNILRLLKNSTELMRYSIPSSINVSPISISWNYVPAVGTLTGCSSCQITLSSNGNSEIISISNNGMVY